MAKFRLGQITMTPGAQDYAEQGVDLLALLRRHAAGDWGNLSEGDIAENELSLQEGFRLLSAYETPAGRVWIITEADRSSTCILLPSEY